MELDRKIVFSGFIWRFAERCGAQLVQFIVSVILARILEPEAYGTIALITVFITILQVFVDSGLGNALIQKKDADDIDFSTVFYTNICFCFTLYIGMFFAADLIASFYKDPALVPLIRVLSLTIIISGVKNVQQAYISRNMMFRKFFFATLAGTIAAAVAGIAMAYRGMGVWALVAQQLLNLTIDTIVLWITVKWRPKRVFSAERLKGLFSYGWKLLVSRLLDAGYNNIRQLIIGKLYTSSDLAFYNRGKQFPNIIVTNVNSSIDSVLLPAMSMEQDDRNHVKDMTRRSIKISVYVMAPLMIGLAVVAPTVVKLVLTDKWLPCIPFLRIFCIMYMFYPIHTSNLNAIKAMGRSDLFLKLEIEKKTIGIVLLLATMRQGVMAMAYSLLVSSVISQLINSGPNKKLLGYGYIAQLMDILPSIMMAVGMGICVSCIGMFDLLPSVALCIQVVIGLFVYILESVIFKDDSFFFLWGLIKGILKN